MSELTRSGTVLGNGAERGSPKEGMCVEMLRVGVPQRNMALLEQDTAAKHRNPMDVMPQSRPNRKNAWTSPGQKHIKLCILLLYISITRHLLAWQ